ncbi:MAG TPA: DUF1904 family protein, partial [Spirochaetales bacterium]|nr:DUF1904 family protein [Spirochaetales bacterium]
MPHLSIRNVSEETVRTVSATLADEVAKAVGCERSWITLDCLPSVRIQDGERIKGCPLVEVLWYSRPLEMKRAVAGILTRML